VSTADNDRVVVVGCHNILRQASGRRSSAFEDAMPMELGPGGRVDLRSAIASFGTHAGAQSDPIHPNF
jgi:hypothetical protein